MLRNLLFVIGIVLTSSVLVFSQSGSGTLKGKIIDRQTKEPIPFANIVVETGGVQIGGTTSDFDGNYQIKPVPAGKVDLKATYVGYRDYFMQGVIIFVDKITFQDVDLETSTTTLSEVEIVDYKVPLISKDQTVSGGTVTQEEISKMANKSASAVATTVGGVTTNASGGISSIRGARSNTEVYYIDGMRVVGSASLPQSAIEQVEVILGGTPASYGDAAGGIISVTTRGPSRDFSAGIDLQTSQFLDPFGYNRVGLNLTGPLFSKKDTVAKTKIPIMGYFIAGDFTYRKDGAPSTTGLYKANDDVINLLSTTPLRLNNTGEGVLFNGEFLTMDDLEKTRATLNTSRYEVLVSGKLDFRLSPTINMSFGGTFQMYDRNNFSYGGSLLNYANNSHSTGYVWRVNGRFTQRFRNPEKEKVFVDNIYYSIGADYTRTYDKTEDAEHKEDIFKYGYIGRFETNTIRAYTPQLEYDSVSGKYAYLQNGFRDTIVLYTPYSINAEPAAWTSQYYNLFANDPDGHYRNTDEIISGKGLINGMEPDGIYGMWQSPGNRTNGFNIGTSDQLSINASFAADFGNHEIQLGLQYQQRSSSFYGYNATSLWTLMNGLTNAQLAELDLANPHLVYQDNVFMDTIYYYRQYVSQLQRNFDVNLRKKLGLPVNGVDFIDINSFDYNSNSINYYDADQQLHTISVTDQIFSIDMFNADELLDNGDSKVGYRGYDYMGNKLSTKPAWEDFFTAKDEEGNYTRPIGAYEPIYIAGYIQDKFAFKDLIFNIGLRVDRFDANQPVLKDPYLFYQAKTAGEVGELNGQIVSHPNNIGNDYVVYVDNVNSPTEITGYRLGSDWYNAEGTVITDPKILDRGNGISPFLVDPGVNTIQADVFQDYEPQTNFMPRISFSFPISDDALFYAHYDILTQRPTGGNIIDPISYYFIRTSAGGTLNNPALQPSKTIDYELGFQQKINNASSLKLAVFYREMRDEIQQYRLTGAYPRTYYSYTNIDFGTVKGLTLTYDLRRTSNARVRFNYTLQFADGTGSDPNAASAIVRSEQPNLRTLNPLSFDRRHQFNISIDYRWGVGKDYNGPVIHRKKSGKAPVQLLSNFGANFTVTGGSGTPYTKSSKIMPYGGMGPIKGSINGARLPWQFVINMRIDKDFLFAMGKNKRGGTINVYLDILNLLNTQNVTNVYPATGSATDDGYLSAPEYQNQINQQVSSQSYRDLYSVWIANPYNFSSPRQIRLGLMFNF
ncbi:MAG: carboxypeptidase-like regulatory domain-containing protein [Bacteroidales bacterium]|nr:carboxypeptidase-like regulatory domain-containing protein [Bacteroidales bacterium]